MIERLRAAGRDERLATGALYLEAADEIERLTAERDELRDVLLRSGFVPCDIPACNCGSWHHRYGLPERMQEIKDALAEAGHELSNANGNLPINALKALVAERDDHARWRADLADKLHDRETTISAAWEALRSAGVHSEATIDDGIRLLRRQLDEARAEREAMANVLPGHYYMDPPDGGDVPVLEQLRRMATDAERYRDWLRGGANIPPESTRWARWDVRYWDGRHWNTLFAEQMDAAIDAAMGASNE